MPNELITIFTPTYNRAYLLINLWRSLYKQSNSNFIWLIVDDGSSDETRQMVSEWKTKAPFEIAYIYQVNGGKHAAHNKGVDLCKTPLFMCVDSDDILTANAIDLIYSYWEESSAGEDIVGWCTRRGDFNGVPVQDKNWPQDEPKVSCVELFEKNKFHGETALIWKTDYLKKYHFPIIAGEKFITEFVLYYQISFYKNLQLKNDIFYLFAYQKDGYTKQGIRLKINNPVGTAVAFKMRSNLAQSFPNQIIQRAKYEGWIRYFHISDGIVDRYYPMVIGDNDQTFINVGIRTIARLLAPFVKLEIKRRIYKTRFK